MKKLSAILMASGVTAAILYLTKKDVIKEKAEKIITDTKVFNSFKNELYEILKDSVKEEKNLIDARMNAFTKEKKVFEEAKEKFYKDKIDIISEIEEEEKSLNERKELLEKEKESLEKEKSALSMQEAFLDEKDKNIEEKNYDYYQSQVEREKLFEEKNKILEEKIAAREKEWNEKKAKLDDDIAKLEKEKEEFEVSQKKSASEFAEHFLSEENNDLNENIKVDIEENKKDLDTEADKVEKAFDAAFATMPSGEEVLNDEEEKPSLTITSIEEIENKDIPSKISDEYFAEMETLLNTNSEEKQEEPIVGNGESENCNDGVEDNTELLENIEDETKFATENIEKTPAVVVENKKEEKVSDIKIFSFTPENENDEISVFTIKFEKLSKEQVEIEIGKEDVFETKTLNVMDGEINFSLNSNDKATIKDIPINTVFSITQKTSDGYSTKSMRLTHKELSKTIKKAKVDPKAEDAQNLIIEYLEKHNKLIEKNSISNITLKDNKGKELDTYLFVNIKEKIEEDSLVDDIEESEENTEMGNNPEEELEITENSSEKTESEVIENKLEEESSKDENTDDELEEAVNDLNEEESSEELERDETVENSEIQGGTDKKSSFSERFKSFFK